MSSECENALNVPEMELEALRSIYVNELEVDYEDGIPKSVAIWLHPATADNVEEQYVRLFLKFKLSEEYPENVPDITIRNPRGLSDEQINRIVQKLMSIAEGMKGTSMLFELIEAAKEQLTAENRPSEDCAICLYGFMEGDIFTKTDCYHYFHSHCLNRYVKSKLESEEERQEESSEDSNQKPLCPICRFPIKFDPQDKEFPEPVAVTAAYISLSTTEKRREEMEKLYQKQLAQGGIIDVEAEKNKFLLEIANVSSDRTPEIQDTAKVAANNVTKVTEVQKADSGISSVKSKRVSQTHSPKSGGRNYKASLHSSYKQSDRKNYDWSSDLKEQRKSVPHNTYQNRRQQQAVNSDIQNISDNDNKSEKSAAEPDEPLNNGDDLSNEQTVDRNHFTNHRQGYNRPRNSQSNSQQMGPRNYYNPPPYRPYKSYKDGQWKSHGVGFNSRRKYDDKGHDSPSHSERSLQHIPNEKGVEEDHVKNVTPSEEFNSEGTKEPNSEGTKEPISKPHYKRSDWNDKRYNVRTRSQFQHEQNHHSRFSRNHEYRKNSSSDGGKFNENNLNGNNLGRNYNSRPYRPRNYDQNRQYGGHSRSYHENTGSYQNFNIHAEDHSQSTQANNYQQPRPQRYQGNFYKPKYHNYSRNGTNNFKNAFIEDVPKKGSRYDEVSNSSSKTETENISEDVGTSGKTKAPVNCTKVPESGSKTLEKCTTVPRPPPGFANPLKKVVYGLPSVNPPPGFGQS